LKIINNFDKKAEITRKNNGAVSIIELLLKKEFPDYNIDSGYIWPFISMKRKLPLLKRLYNFINFLSSSTTSVYLEIHPDAENEEIQITSLEQNKALAGKVAEKISNVVDKEVWKEIKIGDVI
jgi:hypothetical protein